VYIVNLLYTFIVLFMAINSVGSSKYEDPRKRRAMLHGEYSAMLTKSTDKRATPEQREQVKQLISRLLTLSMSGSRSDVRSRFPAKALKLLDSQRVEDNKEFSDLRYHEAIASCADAWEKKLSLSTIASIDVGSAYANQGIDMIVDWNQELWDMQDSILRSFFNGD